VEPYHYPLLLVAGIATGFVKVMAAGGSLISMPVLILLGLPPATANGTNRIAILVQNVAAVTSFRRSGLSDFRRSLTLSLCTIPGAVVGALVAIRIDPTLFKQILGGVLVMALILIYGPKSDSAGLPGDRRHTLLAHLGAIGAGFYGGFLQAGVGFLIMPILNRLLKLDLVRVNMHKVFIIGAYNVPALLVFAAKGQVWWTAGGVLAVGNAIGGWLGARVSVQRGEGIIRVVFGIATAAMAVKLVLG
jgi:uncharacterized membrane protein YfcA